MDKCNICAERKRLIKELMEHGKKTPEERENAGKDAYDLVRGPIPGSGARSKLNECCGGIVGSVSDHYLGDREKKHHHRCDKCGKRFPEKGSYDGDWVNDNLRGEDI